MAIIRNKVYTLEELLLGNYVKVLSTPNEPDTIVAVSYTGQILLTPTGLVLRDFNYDEGVTYLEFTI